MAREDTGALIDRMELDGDVSFHAYEMPTGGVYFAATATHVLTDVTVHGLISPDRADELGRQLQQAAEVARENPPDETERPSG